MDRRKIGSLEVSLVGIGCNNFGGRIDADRTSAVVAAAIDAGINFFDTADVYGGTHSEELLGRALKGLGKRDAVVIATKFGMPIDEARQGAEPGYVRRALEDSLRRLGTDRIDLYQLHRPDPNVPIADTLGVLAELVAAGKVREIGCSNFSVTELREAAGAPPAGAPGFVSVQNEYSLLHRDPERGVLPECERRGLAFLPYFPLASGLLTGKYHRGKPAPAGARLAAPGSAARFLSEANISAVEALRGFVEARGRSLLELAFSWLALRPVVASVIAGATSAEQVRANAAAVGWKLSADEIDEVNRIAPLRVV